MWFDVRYVEYSGRPVGGRELRGGGQAPGQRVGPAHHPQLGALQ
jgi:hypothetical protein